MALDKAKLTKKSDDSDKAGKNDILRNDVKKAVSDLEAALTRQYVTMSTIKREGNQLIVPDGMGLLEAAKILTQAYQDAETETNREFYAECYPFDGAVAFYNALNEMFGRVMDTVGWVQTMLGMMPVPPEMLTVAVDYDKTIDVPIGGIEIPSLPSVKITAGYEENLKNQSKGKFYARFTYPRKYEGFVKAIEAAFRKELHDNSILKGKAFTAPSFEFMNLGRAVEPIYTTDEQRFLNANLFGPIKMRDTYKKHMSIRRTILAYGRFGTGKTMTAQWCAHLAKMCGWTFINVTDPLFFKEGLQLARNYQPAIVFMEDVDAAVNDSERGRRINDILNEVDGVLSKDSDVIVFITTNQLDRINRAFLRPERASVFELGNLDGETICRFVKHYAKESFQGDIEPQVMAVEAEGFTGAYISDAVKRAIAYAIQSGHTTTGVVHIAQDDVVGALRELRQQLNIMNKAQEVPVPTLDQAFHNSVVKAVHGNGS